MRGLIVIVALVLAGCGTYTPMEELERQALLTGDWSAVEKREAALERRKARLGPQCPAGMLAVCDGTMGGNRCTCVKSDALRSALSRY